MLDIIQRNDSDKKERLSELHSDFFRRRDVVYRYAGVNTKYRRYLLGKLNYIVSIIKVAEDIVSQSNNSMLQKKIIEYYNNKMSKLLKNIEEFAINERYSEMGKDLKKLLEIRKDTLLLKDIFSEEELHIEISDIIKEVPKRLEKIGRSFLGDERLDRILELEACKCALEYIIEGDNDVKEMIEIMSKGFSVMPVTYVGGTNL